MQQEINLLSKLPRGKRNVNARAEAKTDEIIAISREYGELYFDGPRKYGYGGYRYDGRWIPVAEDMVKHFDLKPGDRVLDVGCGKGFLVKDLIKVCPGLEAFGLDISEYALMHCEPEVAGRLHLGNAVKLPFPDGSFKAVISLNTVHNLDRDDLIGLCLGAGVDIAFAARKLRKEIDFLLHAYALSLAARASPSRSGI